MLIPIKDISQDYFFNMLEQGYDQYLGATVEEKLSKQYWYNRCYVMIYHLFTDENCDKARLSKFVESRKPLEQIYLGLCSSFQREPFYPKLDPLSVNTNNRLSKLISDVEANLQEIKKIINK